MGNNSYELYHYGIPGMRWGVRNDYRMTQAHNRNVSLTKNKQAYKSKSIDKATYKAQKKKINSTFKSNVKTFNKKVGQQHGAELKATKQAVKAERNNTISTSSARMNKFGRLYNATESAATAVVLAAGGAAGMSAAAALGPVAVASVASTYAAAAGANYVRHRVFRNKMDSMI